MKKSFFCATLCLFALFISCSKDDDTPTEPKVENPNYLRGGSGPDSFEIKSGFYFMRTGILGSISTSCRFSAQENNIWVKFDWEVPDGSPQIGTFNVSNCLYMDPNEALFSQDIEGTVTIDKVEQTGISENGVRSILLEGSYSFAIRTHGLVEGVGGNFHYEGDYHFYY